MICLSLVFSNRCYNLIVFSFVGVSRVFPICGAHELGLKFDEVFCALYLLYGRFCLFRKENFKF